MTSILFPYDVRKQCQFLKFNQAIVELSGIGISQQNNGLIDLHAMRCAIGFCDTSRTLLKLVLLDKDNKTISNLLDKFIYSAVANFVAPLMLSYAGATALLQRLGQSLRMFPEINKFRKGDTKLSVDEMKFYLTKISESRSKSPTPTEGSDLDEKEDGISNEADMLVSILKKYYGTIPGEQAFAKSQDPQEHLDQCVSCGIPTLLAPRIVRDGWTTHAQHLEAFKNHIEALIKENTEGSKQELVQFISELLYVAANQSGVTLYEQNNSLQRSVSMEGRRLSGAIEASQRRGSVSAQLLQPQLQRLLTEVSH